MSFSLTHLFSSKKKKETKAPIAKVEYTGATKYGENSTNDVYLDFEELGCFPYLKTLIIGDFNINIKRFGGKLTFVFNDESLTLNSDNTDIESTQIKNTAAYFTEIDFELNDNDVNKIKREKVLELKYSFKNKTISFKPLDF